VALSSAGWRQYEEGVIMMMYDSVVITKIAKAE